MITGGAGNDTLTGGTGLDRFVFAPGFGQDRVTDFDADPLNGQDRIDLSAFGAGVTFMIETLGADTLVTVGEDSLLFVGVSGEGGNAISTADFLIA